jgi:hypothetical protein
LQPAEQVQTLPMPEWTGPRCEKCSAPIRTKMVEVCRQCGWYASLGTYLEVDPEWEASDDLNQAPPPPRPSHLEVWARLLPWWAWTIFGTVAAVVAESVVVSLVTPSDSWVRTIWSLTQLMIGFLVFVSCHIFSFLLQVAVDADMNMLDVLLRPLKVWKRLWRDLPAKLWVVNSAAAGLTAMVMSLVVIGGLPYERLLDWGFEEPKKQNLMGAVMSQVQKADAGRHDNLEDAVADFAGSQDLEGEKEPPVPPKPREQADCIILGYRAGGDGQIYALLLGTNKGKKLVFAGTINAPKDDPNFATLSSQLVAARTDIPLLPLHTDAIWVEPKFTCEVSYNSQEKDGRLTGLRWEKYSGTAALP